MAKYKVVDRKTGTLISCTGYSFHTGKMKKEYHESGQFGRSRLEDAVFYFVQRANGNLFESVEIALLSAGVEIAYTELTHSKDEYDRWRIKWKAPKVEMNQIYDIIKKYKLGLKEH